MIRHVALAVLFLAAWTQTAQADFTQEIRRCDFGGNHPDMKPWSLAQEYNKPIALRIVEEAGVGREEFGQSKKAVSLPMQATGPDNDTPDEIMPEEIYRAFQKFIEENDVTISENEGILFRLLNRTFNSYKISKIFNFMRLGKAIQHLGWKYTKQVSENNYVVHWAVDTVAKRYAAQLTFLGLK